jgi:hypothetical protein
MANHGHAASAFHGTLATRNFRGNDLWKFTLYTDHFAITFVIEPHFSTRAPGNACYRIEVFSHP